MVKLNKSFSIIINAEKKLCYIIIYNFFVETMADFKDSLINSKEQLLFEKETLCNNVKVITVTFDQFNASFLNESTLFL